MESGAIVKCLPLSAQRGRDTERGLPQLLESLSKGRTTPKNTPSMPRPCTDSHATTTPVISMKVNDTSPTPSFPRKNVTPYHDTGRESIFCHCRHLGGTNTNPSVDSEHTSDTVIPAKERHPVPRYGAGIHPRAPAINHLTTGRPTPFSFQVVRVEPLMTYSQRILPHLSYENRFRQTCCRGNPCGCPSPAATHFIPLCGLHKAMVIPRSEAK